MSTLAADETVTFRSTVSFTDQTSGRRETFSIVASHDAAPNEGRLSEACPVAKALIGHRAGEVIEVPTPRGARALHITQVA